MLQQNGRAKVFNLYFCNVSNEKYTCACQFVCVLVLFYVILSDRYIWQPYCFPLFVEAADENCEKTKRTLNMFFIIK